MRKWNNWFKGSFMRAGLSIKMRMYFVNCWLSFCSSTLCSDKDEASAGWKTPPAAMKQEEQWFSEEPWMKHVGFYQREHLQEPFVWFIPLVDKYWDESSNRPGPAGSGAGYPPSLSYKPLFTHMHVGGHPSIHSIMSSGRWWCCSLQLFVCVFSCLFAKYLVNEWIDLNETHRE